MGFSKEAVEGTSGLPDRMWFKATTAEFKYPFEKAPETCALVLEGEAIVEGERRDEHIWLKPGKFEPGDKEGTFALHADKQTIAGFNKNSGLGKFIKTANSVEGLMDYLYDQQPEDRHQYETCDALIWTTVWLDIETLDETFTLSSGPDKGKEVETRVNYVRGWLPGDQTPTSAAGTASSTTGGPSSANGSGSMDREKATELANEAADYLSYLTSYVNAGGNSSDEMAQQDFYSSIKS